MLAQIRFVQCDEVFNECRLLLLFYIFMENRYVNRRSVRRLVYYDNVNFAGSGCVYDIY